MLNLNCPKFISYSYLETYLTSNVYPYSYFFHVTLESSVLIVFISGLVALLSSVLHESFLLLSAWQVATSKVLSAFIIPTKTFEFTGKIPSFTSILKVHLLPSPELA